MYEYFLGYEKYHTYFKPKNVNFCRYAILKHKKQYINLLSFFITVNNYLQKICIQKVKNLTRSAHQK